jgi:catechol 2,3-dioxygenase-like lactoylglutathione lyase family enzyme
MRRFLVLFFAACCLRGIPALAEQLPLLGLAQVNIGVSNLDQARAFYSGIAGFDEVFDSRDPDGSVAAAYFKVNDEQFLEIVPVLKANEARPMAGFSIRTNQIGKLRATLAARGLTPGKIENYPDGSTGFVLTDLPGQDLNYLEFVRYGPKSLAARTKGQNLGAHRLATNLEHVGIIATDFDAAYDFYVKTLGFHEVWRRLAPDGSRVVIDHIQMPGPSGDFVELSNQAGSSGPLTRERAGSAAHFALTVPDINAVSSAAHSLDSNAQKPPRYGLDNRWNFNLYDLDGTRVEFMQVADPAHPAPAVVVTPPDFGQAAHGLGLFEGQSDIGNPALAGSATFDPAENQYTVTGAGANIFARNDEFHFVWRRVSTDFSLTATVRFLKQEPPTDRKIALMARQTLDSNAPYMDAVVHGRGLTVLQFREATGDLTHTVRFPVNAPVRIRLERKRGWFTMYAAAEGQPLQELGAYELKLDNPIYLGLAVCSHNAATLETAIFSDVDYETIEDKAQKGKNQ